jgi:hypothetical protein
MDKSSRVPAVNQRRRTILIALAGLVVVWGLAVAGYLVAQSWKVTAEKVREFATATDLRKLHGKDRMKAIQDLAAKLNALSAEERRKARGARLWEQWFELMTDEEKSYFIDATMPTGFKQMLNSFEKLPEEKRRKALDDAVRRMREARERGEFANPFGRGTNAPPPLNEEMRKQITSIGLKSVYQDSSAQTKAELAPLLEEIQRSMESGRLFRR